jgi:hypothetical protein
MCRRPPRSNGIAGHQEPKRLAPRVVMGGCLAVFCFLIPASSIAADLARQNHMTTSTDTAHDIAVPPMLLKDQTCSDVDPLKRYGSEIRFRIWRHGSPVGNHIVRFDRNKNGLHVHAESKIRISILGFTVYRFDYRSDAVWQKDHLTGLKVRVDDDGDIYQLSAARKNNRLVVDGPKGETILPGNIFPTNHWHCGVLGRKTVLNTLTGHANQVDIKPDGPDDFAVSGGSIPALRFDYTGQLRNSVWYDAKGRWIGLRFKAKDGSNITYICETCQIPASIPQG